MSAYNDIYYTACLIEFTGRKTKNSRKAVVQQIGRDGFLRLISISDVNHCLPFEQVSDELIEDYQIEEGTFDTVSECKYTLPSVTRIGRVYARLVELLSGNEESYGDTLYEVMTSSLPDAISDFNSSLFFAPAEELKFYYEEEYKLA